MCHLRRRPGLWPFALTGGHDNRVSVWDLHHGQRRHRFRIVSPVTFLVRPSAGLADSVRALPLDRGRLLVLVATADGKVRALEPRGFPFGARRAGAVAGDAVAAAMLSTGRAVVVTATYDGVITGLDPGGPDPSRSRPGAAVRDKYRGAGERYEFYR